MAIPEEKFTMLETEIAEVVGILLETLSDSAIEDDAEAAAGALGRYDQQVERIIDAAGSAGFVGLQDLCMLFQERLRGLAAQKIGLGEAERELLEQWPTLVIGYVEDPANSHNEEALIEHLQSPGWPNPLPGEEAEMLKSLLSYQAADLSETQIDETDAFAPPAEAALDSEVGAASEPVAVDEPAPSQDEALRSDPIEELISNESAVGEEELAEFDAHELAPEFEPVEEAAETAEEIEETLEPLSEDEVSEPVVLEQDLAQLPVELLAEDLQEEPEASEADAGEDAGEEQAAESAGLEGLDQELIEILTMEVGQMSELAAESLAVASAEESAEQTRSEALASYADEIERFQDAVQAVGFEGLHQACVVIHSNLLDLAGAGQVLGSGGCEALEAWPALVFEYLQAPTNLQICQAIANHLQDARLPKPITADEAAALVALLASPHLEAGEEFEVEERQKVAQPEDVSLELPEDVNPDLLDSLLQELPHQTAELSTAIQQLTGGTGALNDVDVAQRIAHTVKGAANTVGVKGIANLTHHLEDIMLALAKHKTLPNRALTETLMNASDCLESMSEALLGMGEPPTQAQAVLQEVLDWANRIDREGVPSVDEALPPRPSYPEPAAPERAAAVRPVPVPAPFQPAAPPRPAATQPTKTVEAPAETQVPMLRVPAPLVDDLLRLVGETMILTGQVQEQVRKTLQHADAVHKQNIGFQQLAADLERLVDIQAILSPLERRGGLTGDFDPLEFDQYNELHTVTRRLVEAAADSQELGLQITNRLTSLDNLLIEQTRIHRESQEAVMRTRMVPVKTAVPRLQRSVRQTSRLTDKEVELHVAGADTLMDSNVLSDLVDPLMHMLRNAVDHGIESPAERQQIGKDPTGHIYLEFMREGNSILVRCRDDGRGLDVAAIRRTAQHRGMLTADQEIADEELMRMILQPGFSTRTETTQVSGRGIGMDVIYTRIMEMKGSFNLRSQQGQGATMEMRLPLTLISTHALLVRVGLQTFAISERGVEQILYAGSGRIRRLGKVTTYQIGDEIYALNLLEDLLNLPPSDQTPSRDKRPVLLVREESGSVRAVLVEAVLDSRDLVVKNLGAYLPKLRGIVGATILGDGSVTPVLDLPDLLRSPAEIRTRATAAVSRRREPVSRRTALVVDDSLSARRSLAQFVQDAGFEVRTARDGLEAIEVITEKRPDILLVDLEMPRMNGLELTSHVRAGDTTKNLPVIMITSRSTAKHRREAETAGVNVYLTKPFAEDELLRHINTALGGG